MTTFKKRLLSDTNGLEGGGGEVKGSRGAWHSEGLQNLCSLSDITRMTESRRTMSWQELVARMGEKSSAY
jgi:hypothetical protein